MRAAVVRSSDAPPCADEWPEPIAGDGEQVVAVVAAALHPRVRSQADGSHYTSSGALSLVPGIDAVVRDADGRLRYAILDDTDLGTFAERTVIETRRSVELPDDVDPVRIAAAMNPLMSSWMALRQRVDVSPEPRVLILGATGSAGSMAIQVAKHLGAREVIAAGRDRARLAELPALGADRTCPLDDLAAAADVDVVLDYLWGEPTAAAMIDVITHRADRSAPLTWIEAGAIAGAEAAIPAAALRAARLQIVGSGIGSVPGRDYLRELPALAAAIVDGPFEIRARTVPLADVEAAWTAPPDGDRIVLVP